MSILNCFDVGVGRREDLLDIITNTEGDQSPEGDCLQDFANRYLSGESEKPVFGYCDYAPWKDFAEAHKPMKPNPTDPHHVLLSLITDLHSTNLSRQKELLELRDQNRKLMSDSNGYRELSEDRLKVLAWIRLSKGSRRPNKGDLQKLLNEIYELHDNR